jgi:hypothetical protein
MTQILMILGYILFVMFIMYLTDKIFPDRGGDQDDV